MIELGKLFDSVYGANLEFKRMTPDNKGIPFVSRQEKNNGVVSRVRIIDEISPNPANTISVATSGSVLSSFLQKEPYYSAT